MLPVKVWFVNVYTYPNPKPTLTVMQIHEILLLAKTHFVALEGKSTVLLANIIEPSCPCR